jgi:hypothetical protein
LQIIGKYGFIQPAGPGGGIRTVRFFLPADPAADVRQKNKKRIFARDA